MNKTTFALASLSLAAAGAVLAQAPPSDPALNADSTLSHTQFSTMDSNKDGRISRAEGKADAGLKSSFKGLDTDHDKYLSATEFGKWNAAPASHTMAPGSGKSPMGTMPGHTDGGSAPSSESQNSTSGSKDSTNGRL